MDEIRKELASIIAGLNGRNLSPADVVDYARSHKDSAITKWLGAKGCWNGKEAQKKFALLMARDLIRTVKVYIEQPSSEPVRVRAYVSLDTDRQNAGGYREVQKVMDSRDLRAAYVRTAMKEFMALKLKYAHLKELQSLWDAVDELAAVPA